MEIKIERNEFYRSISRVQSIIEKRSNMPILSMVLLQAEQGSVLVSATDLEISFQQTLGAEVKKPGSITISGRKLFEILKETKSSHISMMEKDNNWVHISDDRAKFNLASLSSDEFPVFTEPEEVPMVQVKGEVLSEMIRKTIYAVTMDEAGFKLSGVFTEKVAQEGKTLLRMVSTDGHRLSMCNKDIDQAEKLDLAKGVMVPKKGMVELIKMASEETDITIGFKQNHCIAKSKDSLVVIRLLESKFPDYNAVVPKKADAIIEIQRESLLDAMKKMVILSNESYRGVKITLDDDRMELVSINPDLGDAQETLEVKYKAKKLEAGFNARYFIDVLQVMDSDIVELGFINDSSPCLLRGSEDKGFLGLIMPMRL
jgi:DNA polymerase-3 subunit beta